MLCKREVPDNLFAMFCLEYSRQPFFNVLSGMSLGVCSVMFPYGTPWECVAWPLPARCRLQLYLCHLTLSQALLSTGRVPTANTGDKVDSQPYLLQTPLTQFKAPSKASIS